MKFRIRTSHTGDVGLLVSRDRLARRGRKNIAGDVNAGGIIPYNMLKYLKIGGRLVSHSRKSDFTFARHQSTRTLLKCNLADSCQ